MRTLQLAGSPLEMGRNFGETCRTEISALYAIRVRNALAQAREYGGHHAREDDLLRLAATSFEATRAHDPEGCQEMIGIAEGADLRVEQILALGGLTDFRDGLAWGGAGEALGGCSACIVQRDTTQEEQLLYAQTWDLGTDNMPFVIGIERRPTEGPATWCITTTGCLSLVGINECGIAVGTTNLRTRDAGAGVMYLSAIHKALSCERFDDAVDAIALAPRAGGHNYAVLDASGRATWLECSARHCIRRDVVSGVAVRCNHCLEPRTTSLEADIPLASSRSRRDRLAALLDGWAGELDEDALESFMADEANGANAICRDDFDGISTNAAVVISPETGAVRVCHGVPSRGRWEWLREAEKAAT